MTEIDQFILLKAGRGLLPRIELSIASATGLELDGGFRELCGECQIAHAKTAASALELRDLAVDVAHAHSSFASSRRRRARAPLSPSPLVLPIFRRSLRGGF